MSEPRLQDIEDYNGLRGEKRRVVWAIIVAGILMSIVYGVAVSLSDSEESLADEKIYKTVPMR